MSVEPPETIFDRIQACIEVNDFEDSGIESVGPLRHTGAHGVSSTYGLLMTDAEGQQWLIAATKTTVAS